MDISTALPSMIGEIYDCAIDARRWRDVLERLATEFDCVSGSISVRNPATGEFRNVEDWGMDPGYKRLYVDTYYRFSAAGTLNCFGAIDAPTTAMDLLGEAEWFNSRFYREWCKPQGLINSALALIARSEKRVGLFSLVRSEAKGRFSPLEMAAFAAVAPHVRRAAMISDFMCCDARDASPLAQTLDLLDVGVVLVDAQGRIERLNRAAEEILDNGAGLRREKDALVARDQRAAAELKAAILSASGDAPEGAASASLVIPALGADLAAWVLPLQSGARRDFGAIHAATAAVFVRPLAGASMPFPGEILVRRYSITQAELRLMIQLSQGMSLQEAADALKVTMATVKTHLIHIFAKTGTHSQAELMRLTMGAIAPVRAADK